MSGSDSTSPPDSPRSGQKHGTDDRISDLPDSILGNILSFLPTNDAVATAVLSKRWNSLWTLAANLHFSCLENYTGSVEQFVQFVNYVLLFHKHGCFQRLSLTWKTGCIPFYVHTWISVALDRGVCGLFVSADISKLPNRLHSSLFSSEILKSLELDCNICIPSSEIAFNLPRLERLELISVYFKNFEDIGEILNGCPVLKYLIIHMDVGEMAVHGYVTADGGNDLITTSADGNPITCMISSASLTHLEICVNAFSSSPIPLRVVWIPILDVPSVHYIKLDGFILGLLVQEGSLALLDEVHIEINGPISVSEEPRYCDVVVTAFSAFICAKTLTLLDKVIPVLSYSSVKMTSTFERLTRLEVSIDCSYWSSLLDFIMLSDNLQALIVHKCGGLESDVVPHDNDLNTNEKKLDLVPRCVSKSLQTVSIGGYYGHCVELAMIEYIIKHASVLKIMEIGFEKSISNDFKRKCPRMSKICEVKFHDRYSFAM